MNLKIAIIEPVGGHGGMNYYDFSLAKGISLAGIKTFLYTCDKTHLPKNPSFTVKRTFKKIWDEANILFKAMRFFICLVKTMIDAKNQKIDIVHFHFFHYNAREMITVLLAKIFRFKIVITSHDVESFHGRSKIKRAYYILSLADHIIAHNLISKKELMDKIKLPEASMTIIPHGNYIDYIHNPPSQEQARKALKISPDSPVLLFFGQIKKVKGLDVLLKSLPKIIKEFPTLQLVIAGKVWKDNFENYQAIINKNKLENNIFLHIRYIPDEEVSLFYSASDMVVLPYQKIYQSGVLLMAMSYKKPVMVSNIDGMTEIIQHNTNGYLFETENSEDLANKTILALRSPNNLMEIANKGYSTILNKNNWIKIGRQTADLYRKLAQ